MLFSNPNDNDDPTHLHFTWAHKGNVMIVSVKGGKRIEVNCGVNSLTLSWPSVNVPINNQLTHQDCN